MLSNKIQSVQFKLYETQLAEIQQKGSFRSSENTLITLASNSSSSILGRVTHFFLTPLRWVGKSISWVGQLLTRYIFVCCNFGDKDRSIDWHHTKEIFDGIIEAVITSKDTATDRQKRFDRTFAQLSDPAKERFREHIGFMIAAGHAYNIKERTEQEKWYKEEVQKGLKKDISEHYLGKISGNKVLIKAVENFRDEINQKLKS